MSDKGYDDQDDDHTLLQKIGFWLCLPLLYIPIFRGVNAFETADGMPKFFGRRLRAFFIKYLPLELAAVALLAACVGLVSYLWVPLLYLGVIARRQYQIIIRQHKEIEQTENRLQEAHIKIAKLKGPIAPPPGWERATHVETR